MAKHNDSPSLFPEEPIVKPQGPVECLGMTFENDKKRREYFLEKLREKLKDPEFRKIEVFPIGEDEDILAPYEGPLRSATLGQFAATSAKMRKRLDKYLKVLTKGKELGRARIALKLEHYHE